MGPLIYEVLVYTTYSERTVRSLRVRAIDKDEAYSKVLDYMKERNKIAGFEYYSEYKTGKEIKNKDGSTSLDSKNQVPVIYLMETIN